MTFVILLYYDAHDDLHVKSLLQSSIKAGIAQHPCDGGIIILVIS